MQTLHIVIEDRDSDGDLRDYQKHEITDGGHLLYFCHYIIRTVDDVDMANAASALSKQYVDDLLEHMRLAWDAKEVPSPDRDHD
jgi:hypothetical protein